MPSDRPIQDAIDKIDALPTSEGEIGIVAREGGNVGLQGEISKPLGKGWSFGAAGEWMRKTGWSVAAKFGWKG